MMIYREISPGFSDDAEALRQRADWIRSNLSAAVYYDNDHVLDELEEIASERNEANWDGHDALPIDIDSYIIARNFFKALSPYVPCPDVDVDPDGEVSFEWYDSPRRVFTISVSPDGELNFAGLYGFRKLKGVDYFADVVPNRVIDGILRVYK